MCNSIVTFRISAVYTPQDHCLLLLYRLLPIFVNRWWSINYFSVTSISIDFRYQSIADRRIRSIDFRQRFLSINYAWNTSKDFNAVHKVVLWKSHRIFWSFTRFGRNDYASARSAFGTRSACPIYLKRDSMNSEDLKELIHSPQIKVLLEINPTSPGLVNWMISFWLNAWITSWSKAHEA